MTATGCGAFVSDGVRRRSDKPEDGGARFRFPPHSPITMKLAARTFLVTLADRLTRSPRAVGVREVSRGIVVGEVVYAHQTGVFLLEGCHPGPRDLRPDQPHLPEVGEGM